MARAQGTLRAFLAVEVPGDVRSALRKVTKRLRNAPAKVSWVKPENLHLTLRFLGEVEPSLLDDFCEGLAPRLASIEAFGLRVRNVGAFPKLSRPSVIWAGVDDPTGRLIEAQAIAEEAAQRLGLEEDGRGFTPHITLGRVRAARPSQELIDSIRCEKEFEGGEFMARAVSLFSSDLTAQGANHHRLLELPFKWISISESPTAP